METLKNDETEISIHKNFDNYIIKSTCEFQFNRFKRAKMCCEFDEILQK